MTKVKVEDADVTPSYKTVVLSIWINFHATSIHMGNSKERRNMAFIRFVKYPEIKQNRLSINLFIILDKGMCQSPKYVYIYFPIQLNLLDIYIWICCPMEKVFKSDLLFLSGSFLPQLWHIVNCLEESCYNV